MESSTDEASNGVAPVVVTDPYDEVFAKKTRETSTVCGFLDWYFVPKVCDACSDETVVEAISCGRACGRTGIL